MTRFARSRLTRSMVLLALAAAAPACASQESAAGARTLRLGHFPNVTHAQALVAHAMSREGRGWFEQRLGPGIRVEWFVYNAGPGVMEAFFAGSLDAAYVGPSPALNAHVRSAGDEVRILAGAALGGSALLVPDGSPLREPADFRGKVIATPQLGNTQDVACRSWLTRNGFRVTQMGGDVHVLPAANPDILLLFSERKIDAAWTVEPWVSILERESAAKVFLEEPEAVTTVLAASAAFLRERPAMARALAAAHDELTHWLVANPEEARRLVSAELEEETGRAVSDDIVASAWNRLTFTTGISIAPFEQFVIAAREAGFLRDAPALDRLLERPR